MKKKTVYALFFLLIPAWSPAMGDTIGDMRSYPVENFTRLTLRGNYKVILYQSQEPFLKVKASSDELYDALDIDSDGRSLGLSVRREVFNLGKAELHIGFPSLEKLSVTGGVKLETHGYLELNDLHVRMEGGVNVDLKAKARTLEIESSGGALFDLSGVSERLSVKVMGAGHVNAGQLTAREVIFRVEGVGFGSVHATDLLDVKIEGVGKVTYRGNPEVRRIVEGLGSVAGTD